VNQPAGKPPAGTCIDPSERRPSLIREESTPIAAICRRTGADFARWSTRTSRGTRAGAGATLVVLGTGGTFRVVAEAEGAAGADVAIVDVTVLVVTGLVVTGPVVTTGCATTAF
jgi:hypothetical protein